MVGAGAKILGAFGGNAVLAANAVLLKTPWRDNVTAVEIPARP